MGNHRERTLLLYGGALAFAAGRQGRFGIQAHCRRGADAPHCGFRAEDQPGDQGRSHGRLQRRSYGREHCRGFGCQSQDDGSQAGRFLQSLCRYAQGGTRNAGLRRRMESLRQYRGHGESGYGFRRQTSFAEGSRIEVLRQYLQAVLHAAERGTV